MPVWTVSQVIELMDQKSLLADMFPSFNEMDGTWDISLNDERGNCLECISFATEEQAEHFCEELGEAIEARALQRDQE